MSTPDSPDESQAASLAAALVARIGPLAQAAAHAKDGIAADRESYAGAGEADALISTVIARVDELEGDCRRLMKILSGFEAAATAEPELEPEPMEEVAAPAAEAAPDVSAPAAEAVPDVAEAPPEPIEPAPSAEPTPAQEAAGIVTFPGTAEASEVFVSAAPEADALTDAPPTGEPVAADAPPTGVPLLADPPPVGPPVSVDAPDERIVPEPEPQPEMAPPSGAPVVAPEADEPTLEAESAAEAAADDEPVHVSEGVRLLATQMSVAGASTADIAKRLHNDFGVQDADRLIAHLFGPGPQG